VKELDDAETSQSLGEGGKQEIGKLWRRRKSVPLSYGREMAESDRERCGKSSEGSVTV